MELEKKTLDSLINYLKEHGYPDSSFAIEYKIGKQRIDLAIIDPDTQIPILVFELKSSKSRGAINFGKKQLESYLTTLPDTTVPAYLVFPKENKPYFEVQRMKYDSLTNNVVEESVTDMSLLDFAMHKQSRISEKSEQIQTDRSATVDQFTWISWGVALLLVILLVLNKCRVISLDAIDLTIIGAIIGLIILPFSSKLKFLGMEFERFEIAKKK